MTVGRPTFNGRHKLPYVQPDRILKGVVNNVTKFVDIVVNQDGFDHTSEPTTTTKFLTKSPGSSD